MTKAKLDPSIDAHLTAFQTHLTQSGSSPYTARNYRSDLRRFAKWLTSKGRPFDPEAITHADVKAYHHHLSQKATTKTISHHLSALRAYIAWARAEGAAIPSSPLNGLVLPPNAEVDSPKARIWLNAAEQKTLLRALQREVETTHGATQDQALRDQAIIVLSLHTGLTVGELCALKLKDVTAGKEHQLKVPGRHAREIPLNDLAWEATRQLKDSRPKNARDDNLLINKERVKLRPRGVQRMLAKWGERVGLRITPQTLRHTFARNLTERGVAEDQIASLLGVTYAQIRAAYSKSKSKTVSPHDTRRAVDALAK